MIIDDFDKFIITSIFEASRKNIEIRDWDISKSYAKKIGEPNADKVYKRMKARLEKYVRCGIFYLSKNGDDKNCYCMDLNKITIKRNKFPDGYAKAILIRI